MSKAEYDLVRGPRGKHFRFTLDNSTRDEDIKRLCSMDGFLVFDEGELLQGVVCFPKKVHLTDLPKTSQFKLGAPPRKPRIPTGAWVEDFQADVRADVLNYQELREKHDILFGGYRKFCQAYVMEHNPSLLIT